MKKLLLTPDNMAAALDGRKTQTRRLDGLKAFNEEPDSRWLRAANGTMLDTVTLALAPLPKPAHAVGDVVVGATTWAVSVEFDHLRPTEIDPREELFWYAGVTEKPQWAGKSRPGRFLPKSLYRFMPKFEITAVRVERLHDITLADAIMEGCPPHMMDGITPLDWFEELWNSINEKRGGWEFNPWVFVYGFERSDGA